MRFIDKGHINKTSESNYHIVY